MFVATTVDFEIDSPWFLNNCLTKKVNNLFIEEKFGLYSQVYYQKKWVSKNRAEMRLDINLKNNLRYKIN